MCNPSWYTVNKPKAAFTLIDIAIGFVVTGILAGLTMGTHQIIKASELKAQIIQIEKYKEAVESFNAKFEGLPGDLLAAQADRMGLVSGDGTPSHSDGDGKIAPCNLGWQWHLGCENALFWEQLSLTGYISESFVADKWLADSRLNSTGELFPYLPTSTLNPHIYVMVWNSDVAQPSPGTALPYGNYFELSHMNGVEKEDILDTEAALTPMEARTIDEKIDDGLPYFGHIYANGNAKWPQEAWGSMATRGDANCVTRQGRYNTRDMNLANKPLCHIAIAINCCEKQK